MKKPPLVFSMSGNEYFADAIVKALNYEHGEISLHQFPDEETVIRLDSSVNEREVIFICTLDRPNKKMIPLLFAAETAKNLGATKVGIIAPYLAYMRQDKQFHPGEGISSKYFAKLLSTYFDWLITIDPHLHRYHSLNELYSIPTSLLHAVDTISAWINNNVEEAVLIGPDVESLQWVSSIAKKTNRPFLILEKVRKGDKIVEVSIPQIESYRQCTPVLIDDIISTAATMIETVKHLQTLKMKSPLCIGIHAVFSGNAYHDLLAAGANKVVTCNTVKHPSNTIDLKDLIIDSAREMIKVQHG